MLCPIIDFHVIEIWTILSSTQPQTSDYLQCLLLWFTKVSSSSLSFYSFRIKQLLLLQLYRCCSKIERTRRIGRKATKKIKEKLHYLTHGNQNNCANRLDGLRDSITQTAEQNGLSQADDPILLGSHDVET